MAKVHEYIMVLADGTFEIAKSNGPICFQQSRQELGGHFESWNPQLGVHYTAQIAEFDGKKPLPPNAVFAGVAGKVLIGRNHGAQMWGLTAVERSHVLAALKLA